MQHVINIHKLDNGSKILNKDMQTNNETEFLYASCARDINNWK